jgi:hypothetical protein
MEIKVRVPDFKYNYRVYCPKCGGGSMQISWHDEDIWYSYEGNFLFDMLGLRNTKYIIREHLNLDCVTCGYFVGTMEVKVAGND